MVKPNGRGSSLVDVDFVNTGKAELTIYSMADSDCCDLIKGNRQALGQSSVFFRKSINDKRSLRLGFALLKGIIQH